MMWQYFQLQENQQDNPADARTVEGGMIEEGSDGSMNELDGPATTTQNVEVTEHAVTIASHEDPNVGSTLTEGGFALVTRSNASDGEDDSAEDLVVIKATYATRDDDPSKFPRFDIVPSPPADHIYLDTKEQVYSPFPLILSHYARSKSLFFFAGKISLILK
jgi:hypothetical protein